MLTRFPARLFVCAALVLATTTTYAQAKPDFSGIWTVVIDKSDFGPMPAPASMTRTIVHKEPSLKITLAQAGGALGDTTTILTFTTDGTPHTNTISGNSMTTSAKWDGTAIVMSSTTSSQGTDVHIDDRYELSDAGKTLTLTRHYSTAGGDASARIVMTKTK